jgi:hypothetical protein
VSSGARLKLWLADGGANDGEVDELCEILRNSGASGAQRPLLPDPLPGHRGAEETMADVVATVEPTVGLVRRILGALRSWLATRPRRNIELCIGDSTIKINGFSSVTEDRLVEAFLQSVAKGNDR